MSDDYTGDHANHSPVAEARDVETDIETVVDEQHPDANSAEESEPTHESWFEKIRNWVFSHQKNRARELQELNQTIALHPDVAMNYVLRGELYLQSDDVPRALDDFRTARILAEACLESADWGLIDQIAQDRAQRGVEKARRRLSG